MLMLFNMYKIVGELIVMVLYVVVCFLVVQGLFIFGDYSDVMVVRNMGFVMLSFNFVQEVYDFVFIVMVISFVIRILGLYFFDGFCIFYEE